MLASWKHGALAALVAVMASGCGGGGGGPTTTSSGGGGGTSATVQGVSMPSSVSVVTATNVSN